MFSRIFSPSQLKEYKRTCMQLRHAANSGWKVRFNFLKSEPESCKGKLIRLENEFYLKRKKNKKELFSININRIIHANVVDGLLNIDYSGTYKIAES